MAAELGPDTRIGLEDILLFPDGTAAPGNAALIRAPRDSECGEDLVSGCDLAEQAERADGHVVGQLTMNDVAARIRAYRDVLDPAGMYCQYTPCQELPADAESRLSGWRGAPSPGVARAAEGPGPG